MFSVLKPDTIKFMKFSRIITARIDFQSVAFSPRSKHIDSRANLTIAGGLAIDRTSTRCCFLIDFTATKKYETSGNVLELYYPILVVCNRQMKKYTAVYNTVCDYIL